MAVRTLLTAKSGNDAATLTTGASGNSDFDSLNLSGTGNLARVRLNFPTTNARGARFTSATASGVTYGVEGLSPSTEKIKLEIPYRHEAVPSAEIPILWLSNGTTRGFSLAIAPTSGAVRLRDSANVATTMTGTIPYANNNYVILLFVNRTTGVVKVQVWLRGAATFITNGSVSLTSQPLGSLAFDTIRLGGKASTGTVAYDNTFGDVIIDTDATDIGNPSWLGPPVIDTTPTRSPYVFLDLSGTTVSTGPVAYTASPSSGTLGTSTGIYLPASTTTDIAYVITATDTGTAQTATLNYTVPAVAGAAQARQRIRRYNGSVLV